MQHFPYIERQFTVFLMHVLHYIVFFQPPDRRLDVLQNILPMSMIQKIISILSMEDIDSNWDVEDTLSTRTVASGMGYLMDPSEESLSVISNPPSEKAAVQTEDTTVKRV